MKRIVSPTVTPNELEEVAIEPVVSSLNFSELKLNSKFRESRKAVKNHVQYKDFVVRVKEDLKSFDPEANKYEMSLVIAVCDIAEMYFLKRNSGSTKKKAVIEALKPYFNSDVQLIEKLIEHVFPMVRKSNLYRRNRTRIYNFLSRLVNFFLIGRK